MTCQLLIAVTGGVQPVMIVALPLYNIDEGRAFVSDLRSGEGGAPDCQPGGHQDRRELDSGLQPGDQGVDGQTSAGRGAVADSRDGWIGRGVGRVLGEAGDQEVIRDAQSVSAGRVQQQEADRFVDRVDGVGAPGQRDFGRVLTGLPVDDPLGASVGAAPGAVGGDAAAGVVVGRRRSDQGDPVGALSGEMIENSLGRDVVVVVDPTPTRSGGASQEGDRDARAGGPYSGDRPRKGRGSAPRRPRPTPSPSRLQAAPSARSRAGAPPPSPRRPRPGSRRSPGSSRARRGRP